LILEDNVLLINRAGSGDILLYIVKMLGGSAEEIERASHTFESEERPIATYGNLTIKLRIHVFHK